MFFEGRLNLETWEADGQKRSKLKVVGERMQLIGGKGGDLGERPDRTRRGIEQEQQSPNGKPAPTERRFAVLTLPP